MIINNNIPALNTYRQMGANQANNANSMEKLSSGLRINKAGDDAAGLAISEKMRAQVRGLDQASSNAQDGISMIQTAEGSLQETHNILQRMRELATQSANDTNVDVDRNEIQKEMNALTSEINRIGNTTEFNTQSLLKGNINKADIGATASEVTKGTDATNTQAVWDTGAFSALTTGQSGTLTFNGVTINLDAADANTQGITSVTGTSVNVAIDTDGGSATQKDQVELIVQALSDVAGTAGSPLEGFSFSENDTNITITGPDVTNAADWNGERIYSTGNVTIANNNSTEALSSLGTAGIDGDLATSATSTMTFNSVPTEGSTFTVADKTVGFYDSENGQFADATEAAKAMNTTADLLVDVSGKNTSDIAAAVAGLDYTNSGSGATAKAVGNEVTFIAETAGEAASDVVKLETNDAHAGTKSAYTANATAANTDISGQSFELTVVVGDKAFTVDTSTSGLAQNYNSAGNELLIYGSDGQQSVIDTLKNATASDGTKLSDLVDVSFENNSATDQKIQMTAKNVGTDNIETILTGTNATTVAGVLGISEGIDAGDAGTDAIESGEKNFTASFQVGANQGQSMTINIADMRANALNITGTSAAAAHSDVEGAKFTATANITDGTNNENVEFALDVSTHEAASAATKVINNAIEKVSAQRSDLGAFQNRLEHTISNLGTSSENLQAAESRIRDVDMAKEVMEMTRTNILSQASQAMLAQANQKPQSVLQLLG